MGSWGPFEIRGKNTAVTGAATGIGFFVAKRFVEGGANVLLVDGDERALHRAAARLRSGPGVVKTLVAEIGAEDTPREIVAHAVNDLGSLDVLVTQAGTSPYGGDAGAGGSADLHGLELVCRAAGGRMSDQGSGRIVVIGPGDPVLALTRSLADELGPRGVGVNAVLPGAATEAVEVPLEAPDGSEAQAALAATERDQMRLVANPADVAKVAVFLASPASSYMTGAHVVVDGGRLHR